MPGGNVFYNPRPDGTKLEYGYRGTPTEIELGFDAAGDFHLYEIEWQPDCIAWKVDGVAVYERLQSLIARSSSTSTSGTPARLSSLAASTRVGSLQAPPSARSSSRRSPGISQRRFARQRAAAESAVPTDREGSRAPR